jgi:methylated-DNA-[protein]-cysteine S-methyltransferase
MYGPEPAAVATPIGLVVISGDDERLTGIRFVREGVAGPGEGRAVREAAEQVAAWFEGRLTRFDLPLAPATTPRGKVLRDAIGAIGHGETASYGELAARIGSSARAVGQACARNPFPLVVPCHRVVQAGGALGPYSAGDGPTTKAWLLAAERRISGTG